MSLPVAIENDFLRFEIWPTIGGKISSLIDKADQFELLFNYPSEIPSQEAQYDIPYVNSWHAGWDECIPAVAPSRYVGFPYDGIAVPDHGEIWGLPTMAVPTKNGITTVWHGLRFGYRLARKLYLDGASVISEYTLVNLAPFEFRFVWSQHVLFALTREVHLELDGSPPGVLRQHATGLADTTFSWPVLGDLDLSHPSALPSARTWRIFTAEPIKSGAILRYPARSRSLRIEYSSLDAVPAFWSIWLNTGGWAGHRHFGVQPTTGRFDHLDRAIADHSAATVRPLGKLTWMVKWTVA